MNLCITSDATNRKCSWPKVAVFVVSLSISFIILFFFFPINDVMEGKREGVRGLLRGPVISEKK